MASATETGCVVQEQFQNLGVYAGMRPHGGKAIRAFNAALGAACVSL